MLHGLTLNFEIRPFFSESNIYKVEKSLAAAKTSSERPELVPIP